MGGRTSCLFVFVAAAQITMATAATAESVISGAFNGMTGAIAVNVAAGRVIEQANISALAVGEGTLAIASASLNQNIAGNEFVAADDGTVSITGSFAGASGFVAVNQASGAGILQANVVAIALGINGLAVAEIDLSQTSARIDRDGGGDAGSATVRASISPDSFANASGIIQVSQAVGISHTTYNRFAMTISDGIVP